MITVPEAARRLGLNPETIRRWIRSGKLRAQKLGTQHMIDESDLEAAQEGDTLPLPESWKDTATGERMPDVLKAIARSRSGR